MQTIYIEIENAKIDVILNISKKSLKVFCNG